MLPLHAQTATALAAAIRAGEVSSREVVEAHLARIDQHNGLVNAITVTLAESARVEAARADQRQRSGSELPPLHGVPFTVKENIDCLGSATTHGVAGMGNALPYLDAPSVARMKTAGAILIGRTNMSELGLRLCSDNPLRGRTRNPWDLQRTPGGSSGGDAVALAMGMTPLGLGSDLGGSLRVPAHCCGVAALKPTTGRIAHGASLPPLDYGAAGQLMAVVGPMARSVSDLRLCLGLLHGRDIRDPRSVAVPLSGASAPRRAALLCELPGVHLPQPVVRAVRLAGALLSEAGSEVEEATPPELQRVGEVWHKLVASDLSAVLPRSQPMLSPALYDYMLRFCAAAELHDSSNNRLHEERSRLMRAWSGFFSEYPVLVAPNLTCPPWPLGADLDGEHGLALVKEATRFILPGSALAIPAVALPMGHDQGLPLGVQLYADLWREDLCLEAAETIERGLGATGLGAVPLTWPCNGHNGSVSGAIKAVRWP